jgi:hypothetical protein
MLQRHQKNKNLREYNCGKAALIGVCFHNLVVLSLVDFKIFKTVIMCYNFSNIHTIPFKTTKIID